MTRRIGLVALAVVLALAGTLAVYTYARHADQRAVAATTATTVVVAQKQVPAGTSWTDAVKGSYLTTEKVPTDAAPASALRQLSAPIPSAEVASADIGAGQIVVREMFGAKTATTGPLQIPKGDIAISVALPNSAEVAGYVQSGSQVAIFTTFKVVPVAKKTPTTVTGGADVYSTKLLLPRVDVLAVSQSAGSDLNGSQGTSGGVSSTSTDNILVTLAMSQQDAERVLLGQQIGQLYLGLLSQNSATAPDAGVSNSVVFKPTPIFVK